tara:strand:+ start:848 stop:1168 length:321 start_codon:yes stop_codon:yes gene_type:complete
MNAKYWRCPICEKDITKRYKKKHLHNKIHIRNLEDYKLNYCIDRQLLNILVSTILEIRKSLGKNTYTQEIEHLKELLSPNNIKQLIKTKDWKSANQLLNELHENKK